MPKPGGRDGERGVSMPESETAVTPERDGDLSQSGLWGGLTECPGADSATALRLWAIVIAVGTVAWFALIAAVVTWWG